MKELPRLTDEQRQLAADHTWVAEAQARTHSGRARRIDLFDELYSAALEALCIAAAEYDAERGVPFAGFAGQRCNWACLKRLGQNDDTPSLDGEDELGSRLIQTRETDPAKLAEASEQLAGPVGNTQGKRRAFRLIESEVQTPYAEVGQWMATLRAACFNAVKPSDMTEIMETVVRKAKKGNLTATKLLLDYLAGGRGGGPKQIVTVQQEIKEEA